ncbi:MAG: OmpH family outer membrane protein [Rhodocyclaceae bacterium]|nr:OmpH family outer membrane protein [Rhodocyclaceae bacterium]MCA3145116.1 OmpH family outer membrane protein [Rhodocyclaceae bacterium]
MKHPLLFAIATLFAASAVHAQSNDLKIGVVFVERILKESAPAKKAQQKLEKEFQARDQEIQKLTRQGKDLQTMLEKESVTMSETDRRTRETELGRVSRDLQRLQREFREDFNVRRNEEFQGIIERANKVVQEIAEKEKYDLILQDAVVYRSPRVDITEKVLRVLDK